MEHPRSRGSEWHRWDPHIHTPATLLNNQFGGDWDGYLSAIEKATPVVEALGVTDYCVLRGYKEFLKFRKAGRASEVRFVFPNVEFRLSIETRAGKGVNVHLLFSPDDSDHVEQIERVLAEFKFPYRKTDYPCTPVWLTALGEAVDPKLKGDDAALVKGVEQFKLAWGDLVRVIEGDPWASQNCLIAISAKENDGVSGLKHDGAFEALREELQAHPHIIFSGNPGDREFWLGRAKGHDRESVEKTYGSLKPCLHGSDAHRIEDVLRPVMNRFCWIRAELSFMGLKQTVLDPDMRVHIGEEPPTGPSRSETIDSVRITGAPWLEGETVELNDGLVAIIGPKGSGKTALADIIAHAAGEQIRDEAAFLLHAREFLGDGAASLTWVDGTETPERALTDLAYEAETEPHVRYLSQQFVDRLCSTDMLGEELLDEIEKVVFQAIAEQDRFGATTFRGLRDLRLEHVLNVRAEDAASINEASQLISEEEAKKATLGTKKAGLVTQNGNLAKLDAELKALLPKDKKKEVERLAVVQAALDVRMKALQDEKLRAKKLDDLADEYRRLKTTWATEFEQLQVRYKACNLAPADWNVLRPSFPPDAEKTLVEAKRRADAAVTAIEKGEPGKGKAEADLTKCSVEELQKLQATLTKDIGVEKDRAKKHRELAQKIALLKQAIGKLDKDIADLQGADERVKKAREQRRKAYTQVFESFVSEQAVLEELYAPLREHLVAEGALESRLEFYVRRDIDLRGWVDRGEQLLDLRKAGPFRRGKLEEVAAKTLVPAWRTGGAADVEKAMEEFLAAHWKDMVESKLPETRAQGIAQWLLSTNHVSLRYGIKYEGVDLSKLSPGYRGIVLLMLYLAVDQWDTRPLVVDQPEENLDPQSVYEELVKYFRTAKRRRQVILVTHNPNLVVNADADQVIVAHAERKDPAGLPFISYSSGGLEDKQTRSDVCRILEGGERAFRERERRYALPKDPRIEPR